MMNRPVPLTDTRGVLLVADDTEPECGSVVLTEGLHGTAWQRLFSTGKWHPARGGRSKEWGTILSMRNVILIYDAPPRELTREAM